MWIAEVAQPVPLPRVFDYRVPEELLARARPGVRVRAPFGPRRLVGLLLGLREGTPARELKAIEEILDSEPPLGPGQLELGAWMARRYGAPVGLCLKAMFPPFLRPGPPRPARSAETPPPPASDFRHDCSGPPPTEPTPSPWGRASGIRPPRGGEFSVGGNWVVAFRLTPGQEAAVESLTRRIEAGGFSAVLLHGVPASGKTEVYLRLIREAIRRGGQALYLLPEISLTQPFFHELSARAGFGVGLWHSRLGVRGRREVWEGLRSGSLRVVVGARSACLLPFRDLKLAVVDEEQDESYKQQGQPPLYHVRDVVLERARFSGALAVFGSATPSLEAVAAADSGAWELAALPERVAKGNPAPAVSMTGKPPDRSYCLGPELLAAIRERLSRREQVILLVNRRGYSPLAVCRKCGWVARCPACGLAMIRHQSNSAPPTENSPPRRGGEFPTPSPGGRASVPSEGGLGSHRQKPEEGFRSLCHHCGRTGPAPKACGACSAETVAFAGTGTQRVVADLLRLLPGVRALRMDGDTVSAAKDEARRLYERFRAGEADILVGTKLVAKGFHFPEVTLVGVVDADTMLHMPDFRAAERTVQLLLQAAGRSGRAEKPGEVLIQTSHAGHYALQAAARGEYLRFARLELEHRRELGYPPASSLVRLVLSGPKESEVARAAEELAAGLRAGVEAAGGELLGPAPAVLAKVRGRHRYHILVKLKDFVQRDRLVMEMGEAPAASGVRRQLDVDPYDLF